MRFRLVSFYFLSIFWIAFSAWAEVSHPGLGVEAQYSSASLSYSRQKITEASAILDHILSRNPDYVPALELKALILKEQNDDAHSLQFYEALLLKKDPEQCGPYYFEMGILLKRLARETEAADYFARAIERKFNVSAAHLFLGIIHVNASEPKIAEPHFQAVLKEGLPEMKVVAHFYLGIIYLKQGMPPAGVREFLETEVTAKALPDNKTASDTQGAAKSVMSAFDHSMMFAGITTMGRYDSNISQLPIGTAAPTIVSNSATAQLVLSGSVGSMSPAQNTLQWVPSYQFSVNQNFNQVTRSLDFFSNVAALYINYKPLSAVSTGVELQGVLTFNNQAPSAYTKYSLTGELGPYLKIQMTPHLSGEFDLYTRPQNFYTQPYLSGTAYYTNFTLRGETSQSWLNPSFKLNFQNCSTLSEDFDSRTTGASFLNVMHLGAWNTITLGADLSVVDYYKSSPHRTDLAINPHLSAAQNLSGRFSLVEDLGYTNSTSKISSYTYERFVGGAGISATF